MKEKLKEQIQELFPNEKITIENDGWCSYAFTVGENIVRVPKTKIRDYEREQKVLSFLRDKISVEIPDVQIVYGDLDYAIHKKIKGNNWKIDTYNKLSETAKDAFAQDIANFLVELHRVSVKEISQSVGDVQNDDFLTKEEIYSFLKDDFTEEEIDKSYQWIQEVEASRTDLVFIHQDFHCGNVLVDENHRLKGVFDFGNSCIDDRCLDFHSLYAPSYMELLEKVIEHYENMTSIKIDMNKIKKLKEAGVIYSIAYLSRNPELKENMKKHWDVKVAKLKELINAKD